MKLWCGTGNPGKLAEYREAAEDENDEDDLMPEYMSMKKKKTKSKS